MLNWRCRLKSKWGASYSQVNGVCNMALRPAVHVTGFGVQVGEAAWGLI